jgi:hypothetical protein
MPTFALRNGDFGKPAQLKMQEGSTFHVGCFRIFLHPTDRLLVLHIGPGVWRLNHNKRSAITLLRPSIAISHWEAIRGYMEYEANDRHMSCRYALESLVFSGNSRGWRRCFHQRSRT